MGIRYVGIPISDLKGTYAFENQSSTLLTYWDILPKCVLVLVICQTSVKWKKNNAQKHDDK